MEIKDNWIERFGKEFTDNGYFKASYTGKDGIKALQQFLQKEIDLAYAKGKKENLMMLDSKIMQNLNKALKDDSSNLVEMIKEQAVEESRGDVWIERVLTKDGHVTAVDLHDENTGEGVFCEAVARHDHGKYGNNKAKK